MAVSETIQEILQGIDDAQYGRDMRDLIHKGIQKCYEEGSAGETDLVARNGVLKILEMFGNVETGSTATTAYAVGDTVVYDGRLYKVISAISQGDTFTVDTNIEEVTVKEATVTQPDFSNIENVWHRQDTIDVDETIANDGWYALFITKSAAYTENYISGKVFVSPFNYRGEIAALYTYTAGDAHLMSQWLYFKAGDVVKFQATAQDVMLQYAPCL